MYIFNTCEDPRGLFEVVGDRFILTNPLVTLFKGDLCNIQSMCVNSEGTTVYFATHSLSLFSFDLSTRKVTCMYKNVGFITSMALSSDGSTLYLVEPHSRRISSVTTTLGEKQDKSLVLEFPRSQGSPIVICMDGDNFIWVGFRFSSQAIKYRITEEAAPVEVGVVTVPTQV
jgi:hypothetical protein